MKSNFIKYLSSALALLTIIAVGACAKPEATTPPETPEPAKFVVTDLTISPDTVMPSDKVTVTAAIDNTGGTEGTYTAILTLDGQEVERKNVLIGPGATKAAVFELTSPETDGDYTLSVGEASVNLRACPWVAHTIQYDSIIGSGPPPPILPFWTSWGGYGFLSHFEIPGISFRIKSINIYGRISGKDVRGFEKRSITLRIWDNKLSHEIYSADYSYSLFAKTRPFGGWVKVPVPELRVDDDFYVEVVTNAEQVPGKDEVKCGLYICLCSTGVTYTYEPLGEMVFAEGNADLILNGVVQPWDTRMRAKETSAWTVRVEGENGGGD